MVESLSVAAVVVVLTTAAIWIGSDWLEGASDELAGYYGLPPVVQGAIVVAIGSSFPELASVVFAGLAGSFGLGVGGIVGSAVFNILVIPALATLSVDHPIESNRILVYKEAQFYMISVSVLIIVLALGVIYYPTGTGLEGTITRPIAVAPMLLYGLYVFTQLQDTADYVPEDDGGDGVDVLRQWAKLIAGLLVVLVAVESLVDAVILIGEAFGTPDFLWGVTIIAAATSLPDTLMSVRAAREGRGIVSIGNVLGSNTFDLLVAIPLGVLLVGDAVVDFAVAVPLMAFLTFATILLFTTLRTDLLLTDWEAYGLLGSYVLFVTWMAAEALGLIAGVVPR